MVNTAHLPTLSEMTARAHPDHPFALVARFNRPDQRNALTGQTVDDLTALATAITLGQTGVRALVLTGTGGSFSAGGDLSRFSRDADGLKKANRAFGALLMMLDRLPVPLISLVNGAAFGGAVGLMAVSDLVIARKDAKMAMSETTLGLPPAQIAPFVAARIGRIRARQMALLGGHHDGQSAHALGLVDETAEDNAALETALARHLGNIRRTAPEANAVTKGLINRTGAEVTEATLDAAADAFMTAMGRSEAQEGLRAFLNKDTPDWAETEAETGAESGADTPPDEARP
ncbi:enoyl-CoA hydratase/isomerase family protein [Yunchengibacter salinarum]|uniref:enoyl-CoA hydratase/isomerase family protein n=1 Tax=Yunchengibacter salinarum TaxID=3133399 RepID=UPI0035B667A1